MSTVARIAERLGVFGLVWAGVTAFGFLGSVADAKLDLWMNGWLKNVPFHWTQFFTTKHFDTLLYLHDKGAWLAFSLAVPAFLGLIIATAVSARAFSGPRLRPRRAYR